MTDVTVKKDSLLIYVLKFFGILAGRCGCKGERLRFEISGFVVRIRPWIAIFFLF